MKKGFRLTKFNLTLVALLLLWTGYLGLMQFLSTSSPFVVVRGTSMEPTLHAGDLLLSRGASPTEVQVGDVIAFEVPPDAQERLKMPATAAHRVIGIEAHQGQLVFVTQGDNSAVDPFHVPSSAVRGVVVKNLGPVGWPLLFLTNRSVWLYLGLPILVFVLIVLATLWLSPREKREAPAPATTTVVRTLPRHIGMPLDRLTSAISSYGVHLQSHTSIIERMAGTSDGLEEAIRQQNEILVELAAVVRELKYYRGHNGEEPQPPKKAPRKSSKGRQK